MQKSEEIRVIYEDNHLLVVEKPVNIPSQGDESGDADLLTLLKEDVRKRFQKPGNVYLGLVHRLDRPVGGVMVFAKTSKAASRLSEQVRDRSFRKTYLAVVHGIPAEKTGRLTDYLLKDNSSNTVKTFDSEVEGSKKAVLEYEVLEASGGLALVRINLLTGRSHQVRVQFAAAGHPLFGDQKYGPGVNRPGQQLALWSVRITLTHPTLREERTFHSTPPSVYPWSLFGTSSPIARQ